jgi:putative ABC transport system permease protein
VGLLFDPVLQTAAYVPQRALEGQLRAVGRANALWIRTEGDDPALDETIARGLRDMYADMKIDVSPISPFGQDTAIQIVESIIAQFNLFVSLFFVMAVVIGAVGAVALSGVLTLNVLERRREIGVMRAIGSVSSVIGGMFVGEGLLLGWLSWLIALPLSIPAGRAMTEALGAVVGGLSLVYRHDFKGAAYWFAIITVLSILASLLPARGAIRVSVRESLAYE